MRVPNRRILSRRDFFARATAAAASGLAVAHAAPARARRSRHGPPSSGPTSSDAEVGVHVTEYSRTQFTGALQGYRVRRGADPKSIAEMLTFSGRTIDVPSMFIGGKSDWGPYQTPGALESMRTRACTRLLGVHLVEGAGHWVQQEQPERVSRLLAQFLHERA